MTATVGHHNNHSNVNHLPVDVRDFKRNLMFFATQEP